MRHPGFASETCVELIAAQLAVELGSYFAQFDEIPMTGELAHWRLLAIDERMTRRRSRHSASSRRCASSPYGVTPGSDTIVYWMRFNTHGSMVCVFTG
jgi:hypothetical protein